MQLYKIGPHTISVPLVFACVEDVQQHGRILDSCVRAIPQDMPLVSRYALLVPIRSTPNDTTYKVRVKRVYRTRRLALNRTRSGSTQLSQDCVPRSQYDAVFEKSA